MSKFSFAMATDSSVEVHVAEGLLKESGRLIAALTSGRKALVLTHPVVAELLMDNLRDSLEEAGFAVHPMCLSEGESSKEWDNLTDIFSELRHYPFDRSDVVISLGGGVAGDIATVVAGLYMRGINLVHIPTTLLAQVDSCLGGKGAVNFGPGKNMLGLFYQPRLIIADPDLLKTLPDEEMAAGYAEVVKCALLAGEVRVQLGELLALSSWLLGDEPPATSLQAPEGTADENEKLLDVSSWLLGDRGDEGHAGNENDELLALSSWLLAEKPNDAEEKSLPFEAEETPRPGFEELTAKKQEPSTRDRTIFQELRAKSQEPLITACLAYKATVVAADPLDTGVRQQLNLGHTFAHALEAVGEYSEYNHGQAVGLGLLAALRLSELRYGLERSIKDEVRRLLGDLGLPTCTTYGYDDLHTYFKADKKSAAGRPRFVGLKALSEYAMIEDATEDELREALKAIFCPPV